MASTAVEKKKASPVLGFDPDFGQRLAGEEPYRPEGVGDGFIDERFAPLDTSGSGAGSSALKKFIAEQVAEKTPPSTVHVGDAEFRVYYQDGRWHAVGVAVGLKHHVTGKDRDEVLDKLVRLGQRLETEAIHDLTPSQEIEIARLCQSGNKGEGIARYLEYRIGSERAQQYGDGSEMVSDPELQSVMAECAYFCWLNSRPDVRDSEEFRTFVSDYAGSRPINFDILDAAHAAYGPHQEKQATRAAVARFGEQEQPSAREVQQSLEDMSDEEIRKQYWATAKAVARGTR